MRVWFALGIGCSGCGDGEEVDVFKAAVRDTDDAHLSLHIFRRVAPPCQQRVQQADRMRFKASIQNVTTFTSRPTMLLTAARR